MAAKKSLNIGVVGYGFMGRTHSNGYKRVNDFFDVPYRPVLKAICGRDEAAAKAFAEKWQYESPETDWKKPRRPQRHRRDRHLHPEQHPRRDRDGRRRRLLQDGALREALSMNLVEGQKIGRGDREGVGVPNTVWYNYRRVPAVTFAKQLIDGKASSAGSSITGPTSSRTGRSPPTSRKALRVSGGWTPPPPNWV